MILRQARRLCSLALLLLQSGCIGQVAAECASCVVVDAQHPPALFRSAPRLVLIVPGAIGYGEEWRPGVAALRAAEQPFVVFAWDGWASLARASHDLHRILQSVLDDTGGLHDLVVVGHSVGGMVATYALDGLRVGGDQRVELVTIGAPFAGVAAMPCTSDDDFLHTPALLAMGSCFHHYPKIPERVSVTEYVTSAESDPVMARHFGRDPSDPGVGPEGAVRIHVPGNLNHDQSVELIMKKIASKARKNK